MNATPSREEQAARVVLPFPPSVNALYRSVKGRSILSERYRNWKTEAGMALNLQKPERFGGPVSILVELTPPNRIRRDIDNAGFKAVLDLLKTYGVIVDDDSRYVREVTARWIDAGEPCTVTVRRAG